MPGNLRHPGDPGDLGDPGDPGDPGHSGDPGDPGHNPGQKIGENFPPKIPRVGTGTTQRKTIKTYGKLI